MSNEKPRSKRGGPRPGSGAPKGNLNALKHGLRSRQFAKLGALLAADSKTRDALLDMARRYGVRHDKTKVVASMLLAGTILRARDIAAGKQPPVPILQKPGQTAPLRLNAAPPTLDGRTTEETTHQTIERLSARLDQLEEKEKIRTNNQSPDTP